MTELTQEAVRLPGPRGRLCGELAYSDAPPRAGVLLCNPHPFMGGRMQNNVIETLSHGLASAYATLRFDYAGVGDSEGGPVERDLTEAMLRFWQTGHAPDDPMLVEEARAARRWLTEQLRLPVVLIGYSFGCHAVAELVRDEPAVTVLIAPTLAHHDLAPLKRNVQPKLLIYSDNDFASPVTQIEAWFGRLPEPKRCACLYGAEHFFRGQEQTVLDHAETFIGAHVKGDISP